MAIKNLRRKPKDREEWLSLRSDGIGASESAVVVGASPFMSVNDLWELKTGRKEPQDLSDNEFVQKGIRLEPSLRSLFKANNPAYKVAYHPFDMLYQKERPYLFATLDGEIKDGKRLGVLEIKTATPGTAQGWEKWNEKIPPNYYIQILHQLYCSGYDFVKVFAALFNRDDDMIVRTYHFEREDVQEDIEWLIDKEDEFWRTVKKDSIPPMTFIL